MENRGPMLPCKARVNRERAAPRSRLLGIALLLLLPSAGGLAAERPEGAIKAAGRIQATKGHRRAARAAQLKTKAGEVWDLVLDEKGRSLVQVMHRERAEIWGLPAQGADGKWLKVLDYTDPRVTAAHELWRRMRCNACVVFPAVVNSAPPRDLHGATPTTGRHYSMKRRFSAWARDGKFLWLATDNRILQVDLAEGRLLGSYGRKEGLPDQLVYQLVSDGGTLWIVCRGGVAALKIGGRKIVDLPRLKSKFARAFADAEGVWVIADTGTFRLNLPGDEPRVHPALPSAWRIAKAVDEGLWIPHWKRRTGHFITAPVSLGGRLYVGSYGGIYELDGGKWSRIADGGWELRAGAGRIWFVGSKGLTEYDPETKKRKDYQPPESCRGRYARVLLTEEAAWIAAEPRAPAKGQQPSGGGLARLDLAARKWQAWRQINGHRAEHIACLQARGGAAWVLAMEGGYKSKPAHPGMAYVKRNIFETTGFSLHRFEEKAGKWESFPLKPAELGSRLICGQDGSRGSDRIVPRVVEDICVGPARIFGVLRLMPRRYFGGYWPCVSQIASRAGPGRAWTARFEHHPEQLDLQGEQPLVLNISNGELIRNPKDVGARVLEAVGHDNVLGLFLHGGRHWAVTDGCAGCFDPAAGRWRKVAEAGFRYYWRATCALDDGRSLYVGSDRGLVARLDFATGRFELLTTLKGRAISRILKKKSGDILVASAPAPLGILPVHLRGKLKCLDSCAARFDGKTWTKAEAAELAAPGGKPKWFFKQFKRRNRFDKSRGNFLCGPLPDPAPKFYVKEVFFPLFLCASPDGSRIWASTFTGLLRLDLGGKGAGGK